MEVVARLGGGALRGGCGLGMGSTWEVVAEDATESVARSIVSPTHAQGSVCPLGARPKSQMLARL